MIAEGAESFNEAMSMIPPSLMTKYVVSCCIKFPVDSGGKQLRCPTMKAKSFIARCFGPTP